MFTGLVQRLGTVKRVSRGRGLVLEIAADRPWPQPLDEGESVAVNGVCLTVVRCEASCLACIVLQLKFNFACFAFSLGNNNKKNLPAIYAHNSIFIISI